MDTITRTNEIKGYKSEEVLNFVQWANNQPEAIKTLANKYPATNRYKIKVDAPYGNRIPSNTIVDLYSYQEDSTITVLIREEQKSIKRKAYEQAYSETNQLSYNIIKCRDVIETLDPQWLEPIIN